MGSLIKKGLIKMSEKFRLEAEKTLKMIDMKQMMLNGKTVDLTDMLDRSNKKSIEYREKDILKLDNSAATKYDKICKVVVKTYDSPESFYENVGKTAILNFASSKHPGGGFVRGSMAQEESLCYRSNLYNVLKEHESFYEYNREHLEKTLYTDGVIYSEDVCFFRNEKLENSEPFTVDIITCAAPNFRAARRLGVDADTINRVMVRRLKEIFEVAVTNGVEHLVLGAFGCGVFHNDPNFVAECTYRFLVDELYGMYFKQVTFPMHDSTSNNALAFQHWFIDKWQSEVENR